MATFKAELQIGSRLTIGMPEMGSAGYLWELNSVDPSIALVTREERVIPQDLGIGGFTTQSFDIQGVGPGTFELRHVRPWQREAAPADVMTVTVVA
jgi:predicted secreted protein